MWINCPCGRSFTEDAYEGRVESHLLVPYDMFVVKLARLMESFAAEYGGHHPPPFDDQASSREELAGVLIWNLVHDTVHPYALECPRCGRLHVERLLPDDPHDDRWVSRQWFIYEPADRSVGHPGLFGLTRQDLA